MQHISAVIMLGTAGQTPQEQFVARMKQAATLDLINLLQTLEISPIILCTPETHWIPDNIEIWLAPDPAGRPFHFGGFLAETITANRLDKVMYFGGASAPLIDHELMTMLTGMVASSGGSNSRIPDHIVLTNNVHSSDWAAITDVQDALGIIRQTRRDNSLAWQLQQGGRYEVRVLSRLRPSAGFDIDTPADLALIRQHPLCPMNLATQLETETMMDRIPVHEVIDVLRREGSHLMLMGRVSPRAWEALNKQTQSWIRVFAEERGMVASERLDRGEVRSLAGYLLEAKGHHEFFRILSEMMEAAIIDSRVLMAHHGLKPTDADRYASDLFMVDSIQDSWLQEFTAAAYESKLPVILGGHSVVAGGLHVISDILESDSSWH